jgi:hypothetical protein
MNKAIANKLNAQRSTGPKTAQGAANSSKNAIKHGLTARDTVLASESKEEYEQHLQAVVTSLDAVGDMEMILAQRVADCAWRLRRVMRIESQLFNSGEDEAQVDAIFRPAGVFQQSSIGVGAAFSRMETSNSIISNLSKYESVIERNMYRALHEVQRLRASRVGLVAPLPMAIDIDCTGLESSDPRDHEPI